MAMTPSWETLTDILQDYNNRLRDLETARKVFSTRSQTLSTPLTLSTSGQVNTWVGTADGSTVGPDLPSMSVYSGSMLVVVTAGVTTGGGANPSDAFLSYLIDGPTVVNPSTERALAVSWTSGDPTTLTASYAFMHTGLEPGTYNIYSRYRVNTAGGTPLSGASFKNRHILAVPF